LRTEKPLGKSVKSWFFEEINDIDKCPNIRNKAQRKETGITSVRNENRTADGRHDKHGRVVTPGSAH
jgi:hypothetical protein